MSFCGKLLKLFGWTVAVTGPVQPKCIICVAPHTSNWDFIVGKLAVATVGVKAGFLMKESWFFWPLGCFFRAIGGVPVPRGRKSVRPLTEVIVERFENTDNLVLAITPEGTRSRTCEWHTGFLRIALQAKVPVMLAVLDFEHKKAMIEREFEPSGDLDADMAAIKAYYRPFKGKYPEKFCAE